MVFMRFTQYTYSLPTSRRLLAKPGPKDDVGLMVSATTYIGAIIPGTSPQARRLDADARACPVERASC